MTLNRFRMIFANLRFDDEEKRKEDWKHDRFAAMRYIQIVMPKEVFANSMTENLSFHALEVQFCLYILKY